MTPARFDFSLLERIADSPERVLMLDFDGTLAPFHNARMAARPYPGMRDAILNLMNRTVTHAAIVTGRPLAELQQLLEPPEAIDLWGAHGWERRTPAGKMISWEEPPYATEITQAAMRAMMPFVPPGMLEVKRGAVVIHTRTMTDADHERIRQDVHTQWSPLLTLGDGLEWREFNRGFEFRVTLRTKGTVVQTLRLEHPAGSHLAYLGDDLTDEDAFVELAPPDWGILVASQPRESHAHWWMTTPDDVLAFLQCWTSVLT